MTTINGQMAVNYNSMNRSKMAAPLGLIALLPLISTKGTLLRSLIRLRKPKEIQQSPGGTTFW